MQLKDSLMMPGSLGSSLCLFVRPLLWHAMCVSWAPEHCCCLLSPVSLCLQPDVELDLDTILTEGFPPVAGSIEDLEREERDPQERGGSQGRKGRKVSDCISDGPRGSSRGVRVRQLAGRLLTTCQLTKTARNYCPPQPRSHCCCTQCLLSAPPVLQALHLELAVLLQREGLLVEAEDKAANLQLRAWSTGRMYGETASTGGPEAAAQAASQCCWSIRLCVAQQG